MYSSGYSEGNWDAVTSVKPMTKQIGQLSYTWKCNWTHDCTCTTHAEEGSHNGAVINLMCRQPTRRKMSQTPQYMHTEGLYQTTSVTTIGIALWQQCSRDMMSDMEQRTRKRNDGEQYNSYCNIYHCCNTNGGDWLWFLRHNSKA